MPMKPPMPMPIPALARTAHGDGVDLVHEDDGTVLAGHLAGLAVQHHHLDVADPHEHALEARRGRVGERDAGLRGDALRQVRLAGPRRSESSAAVDLAAHLLEALDPTEQRHPLGQLDDLRVPL